MHNVMKQKRKIRTHFVCERYAPHQGPRSNRRKGKLRGITSLGHASLRAAAAPHEQRIPAASLSLAHTQRPVSYECFLFYRRPVSGCKEVEALVVLKYQLVE